MSFFERAVVWLMVCVVEAMVEIVRVLSGISTSVSVNVLTMTSAGIIGIIILKILWDGEE